MSESRYCLLCEQSAKRVKELEAEAANGFYGLMAAKALQERDELRTQVAMLREALEIIEGKRQCCDNLISNLDIARDALYTAEQMAEATRRDIVRAARQ